ncbi:MAG: GTP cyclohydrolase, FolE2/MptA family [Nitrososphaerota archaeon]
MSRSADVQSEEPRYRLPVDWVTVSNLRLPLMILEEYGVRLASVPIIKASVGLPAHQRGIHASRTYEAISSVLAEAARADGRIASEIARKMLELHSYGMVSRVVINAQAFFLEKTPVYNADSYQAFDVMLRADALRRPDDIRTRELMGVRVSGVTACPCAKEVIRTLYTSGKGGGLPLGTHMQRARASVATESHPSVRLSDLVSIARDSFSNGTVEYLKRLDEARLVVEAIEKPRFVEDVAREIVFRMVSSFPTVPDGNLILVGVKAFESIHDHDLEARLRTTFGEARERLGIGFGTTTMA